MLLLLDDDKHDDASKNISIHASYNTSDISPQIMSKADDDDDPKLHSYSKFVALNWILLQLWKEGEMKARSIMYV